MAERESIELVLCLFKKSINDVLLLLHKLLALFEAAALALDVDDGTVMEHPVEDGGGDGKSANTSFHWEKVLFEVKTVEVFS